MLGNIKKKILIITPEIPWPLRASGVSIRYLPLIERLSNTYTLDLLITGSHRASIEVENALKRFCRNITFINYAEANRCGFWTKFFTRLTFFFPWAMPRGWMQYGGKKILLAIKKATAAEEYDVVVCVSGFNYTAASVIRTRKLIVDFVDSPTLLAKRNVIGSRRTAAVRLFEWLKTLNWEAKIIRKADATVYISHVDAEYIPACLTRGKRRMVIPNGFSAIDYSPDLNSAVKSPNIGFLGNMSYFPNIESAKWLHDSIYKPLREHRKDLNLYIIGREPDESITNLGRDPQVHITGEVENIWPFVNAVDVFVFPLQRGAGQKNKVLEALYAKRPVVTSFVGNEGLGAVVGRDLIVCDKPVDYKRAVEILLDLPSERERLGNAGHQYIVDRFGWDAILRDFECLVNK